MNKFNSKYGVVQEQDRSGFKNHRDGMRSFEPVAKFKVRIKNRLKVPAVIVFDPECSTKEHFLQETGIDLGARYCAACDKIEVELDEQFCDHCAQEKKSNIIIDQREAFMREGIRNWRQVQVSEHGICDLRDITIGEAGTLASFISQAYKIDVTWKDIFREIALITGKEIYRDGSFNGDYNVSYFEAERCVFAVNVYDSRDLDKEVISITCKSKEDAMALETLLRRANRIDCNDHEGVGK